MSDAINQISEELEGISSFVNEIERTGVAVKLIALNAIVKAEHIGGQGAALGVLADAIHHLSFDTDQQTRHISDTFRSITASAEQLAAGADAGSGKPGETTGAIAVNLGLYKSILGEVNETIISQMAVMARAEEDLLHGMETTAAGIDVHETVAEVSGRVATELDNMASEGRALAPAAVEQGKQKGELLRALEESYTMNSERQVHNSIAGSRATESKEGGEPACIETKQRDGAEGDKSEEDFGDNVELF